MSSFLKKRLPALVLAAIGIFLWRHSGALFPTEREFLWQVTGEAATVRQIEVQVWDTSQLLKRETQQFPNGMMSDWSQQVSLKDGEYDVRVFVDRQGAAGKAMASRKVRVTSATPLVFSLP